MSLPETGKVMTQCGWQRYENPHVTRRNAQLVEVEFSDGHTVKCTPEHRFLTASGWKLAGELQTGMQMQSFWTCLLNTSMEGSIGNGLPKPTILAAVKRFIGQLGRLPLDLSRQGAISIIRMGMRLIMPYQTLNAYQPQNIYQSPGTHRLEYLRELLAKQQENAQQIGINQMKEGYGIDAMQNEQNHGLNGNGLKQTARNAIVSLIVWLGNPAILRSIVQMFVKPLHIVSVKTLNETADVWCLTVPGICHFSLANGAIVHNSHGSDAFRQFAQGFSPKADWKPLPKQPVVRWT